MAGVVCHEFEKLIVPGMEGERQPAAETHLGQCAQCRTVLAELEAIQAASKGLAADLEPPARVWIALRSQLEAEGLIRDAAACDEFQSWLPSWMEGAGSAAQAHVSQCASCSNVLADLEAIRLASPALAQNAEPPARIWLALRSQLEAEGLIRELSVCDEFETLIAPWMEGRRNPAAQTHLSQCASCSDMLADLLAIQMASQGLAQDAEPSARVWTALESQLEAQGLVRGRGLWEWLRDIVAGGSGLTLPRPALAGAYAAMFVLGGLLVAAQLPQGSREAWLQRTQAVSADLDTQLGDVERDTVAALHDSNPEVRAALSTNLAMVDNNIAMCEKSVNEQPQNEMARDYLYGAYRQKAELLATMAENGVSAQ